MSERTRAAVRLTPYESEQVERISAWKSTPPNAFAELLKTILLPVANLVEKIVPNRAVVFAIDKAYGAADLVAGQEDIRRRAGVNEIRELRNKPLEECDALAFTVRMSAQVWATIEGAATGAGGVLTTLIDVPLLFVLSLRTIKRIGYCYGYTLDHPHDRTLVLGILITATSGSLATKRQRLDALREVKHLLVEETQEEILADEALSFLFQLEVFEEIPAVGAISGALLNLVFIRRIEVTARRVFQERWLEDNGKVHTIKPAPVHERHLAIGWRATAGRAAHTGCYSIGFGAALPLYMAAQVARAVMRQAGLPIMRRVDTIPTVVPEPNRRGHRAQIVAVSSS